MKFVFTGMGSGGGSVGKTKFGQEENQGECDQPPPETLLVFGIFAGEVD
jgi:hypothetical protein